MKHLGSQNSCSNMSLESNVVNKKLKSRRRMVLVLVKPIKQASRVYEKFLIVTLSNRIH